MAGERYAQRAIKALRDHYVANLETELRAVETEQSLTANSLTDPVVYVEGYLPNDTRSPIIQVFCMRGTPDDWKNGLYIYNCSVVLGFVHDADIEAGQLQARRYLTALLETLRVDRTLGGVVTIAIDTDQTLFADKPSDAETLHYVALEIDVQIDEGMAC